MTTHTLTVEVDYHQLYLWDPTVTNQAPEDYTDEDIERRVKVAPSVVVVQPVRNDEVPLAVELSEAEPGFDPSDWDQIVECSVELPGGKLQVHECVGGPVLDVDVAPGWYAVRVLFAGLDTLSADGLDGEDRYAVQLWPGEDRPLVVVKSRA